ncbi:UDP-N-acetylglucosamine--undecaprenyl-phosphate N-acetylglucosaminephosphotransferase [Aestuariibacter halophilus]|uniref:Undecaprenyl-phosphate alpha-N-acetylglucosaminyl 1-phosphate transferase n=1 Tax=Fluctibacter halophilus TaxID=226011 RepID=A0ABS8G3Z8_9ALTE|nr:UDP-N-acetylglucosamine--undecaprenyl-phosphate N-acetylglucosaminephosphotransferase [Aestuariibacter halophilus]MCC2614826.1 UDP-N-acetylglucosamine--undecaprenyl-phosphate N-acetylglucosaminephosphotransferase [Aestuariibacter halophilus]
MIATFFYFLAAFTLVFMLVLVMRPVAQNVGLVDRPCNRKQHEGEVPLVGGLAIYVAITLCSFIVTPFDANYKIFLLSTSFMVLIGALDDYHDIDARLRLIAQFLIGSLMVFGADLYIHQLGSIAGGDTVTLGMWGPLFTVLAVVTCINAFNMTDGVDGLVGALSINTFISLGIIAVTSSIYFDSAVTSMLAGAVIAFLFFNIGHFKKGRYKIFMGDAGSMLMGLTIIWLITFMTQGENPVMRPVTAVWLIAIPLMDMFSVMLRRVAKGHSPLRASRDHLHHLFLASGCSNTRTTAYISAISAMFCFAGIYQEKQGVGEHIMAQLFIGLFVIYNVIVFKQDKKLNID